LVILVWRKTDGEWERVDDRISDDVSTTTDTEGSFMPVRAFALANALLEHLKACVDIDEGDANQRDGESGLLRGHPADCSRSRSAFFSLGNPRCPDTFRVKERKAALAALTADALLENIRYYRIHNYPEQMALLHLLPAICEEMGNVSRSPRAKPTSI
jgi:hypothetical protein